LKAETGTSVKAVAAGEVVYAATSNVYGNVVVIRDDLNRYSLYAHLNSASVEVKKRVEAGDEVGKSGMSGTKTPHLHFEVRHRFDAKNPARSFDAAPGYLCTLSEVRAQDIADPIEILYAANRVDPPQWVKITASGYRIRKVPSPAILGSELSAAAAGERYSVVARAQSGASTCRGDWLNIQEPWYAPKRGCRTDLEQTSHDCFGDPYDRLNTAIELPRYPSAWICADATQAYSPSPSERAILEFFGNLDYVTPPKISSVGAALAIEIMESGGLFTYYESKAVRSEGEVWDLIFLQHYFAQPPGGEPGEFVSRYQVQAEKVLNNYVNFCARSPSASVTAECVRTRLRVANRLRIGGGRYDEGQRCMRWDDAAPATPSECRPY
jgi:hypothetical protein